MPAQHRWAERRYKTGFEVEREALAGPALITYLQAKLRTLRLGQPIELQYLVAEQAMVLGLRAGIHGDSSDGFTTVRLESFSALLRSFIPTTMVTFYDEGTFVGMQERIPPQKQHGIALDGVIGVTYPSETRVVSMKSSCNKLAIS